jgi:hypothetical protein
MLIYDRNWEVELVPAGSGVAPHALLKRSAS